MATPHIGDPSRMALLEELYKAGKTAAMQPQCDDVLKDIETQFANDREAVHEFKRGLREHSAALRSYDGVLIEHGSAKYNNDPKAKMSYFVTLETARGPKTIWGVDLERAIAVSGVQPGDPMHVAFKGSSSVEVEVDVLDADGNVVGAKQMSTPRNTWSVTRLDFADLATLQQSGSPKHVVGSALPKLQGHSSVATSLLGSGGLSGLKKLFSFGGGRINATVADYSDQRVLADFHDALETAHKMAESLGRAVLPSLNEPGLTDEARQTLVKNLPATPGYQDRVNDLAKQIDKLGVLSEVVISKSALKGRGEEAISGQVLRPIDNFKEKHEEILKTLEVDDKSLFDRLQGIADRLVNFLKGVIDRVRDGLGLGNQSRSVRPGPST